MLGGVGYGAAGSTTVIPSTPTNAAIRDYHFGVTPQALLTLRFIAGDRAMIDMAGREYYVSGLGSDDVHGSETIFRGNLGFNVRLVGGHAIGVRFVESNRDARYGKLPGQRFSEGTVTRVLIPRRPAIRCGEVVKFEVLTTREPAHPSTRVVRVRSEFRSSHDRVRWSQASRRMTRLACRPRFPRRFADANRRRIPVIVHPAGLGKAGFRAQGHQTN